MLLYNAEVHTISHGTFHGYVGIDENGRISAVGAGSPESTAQRDIDCNGMHIYPGFVDIHTHMGFIGDGQGEEGDDVNEGSSPITPQLRAIDGINYYDGYFEDAIKAGVTTVITGAGSLNAIGGTMIAVKTAAYTTDRYGKQSYRSLDDAYIRTVAVKFALGENPKSYYSERDEAPQTRMGTASLIRETLYKAQQYMKQKEDAETAADEPEFDLKYEALIPLLKHEIRPHIHCHRADDILTALRICEEFGFSPLLVHCTEGYKISGILQKKLEKTGSGVVVGPILCDRGKPEMAGASYSNAGELADEGIKVAICTDHPEVMIDSLAMSAAMCAKYGMSDDDAIRAITLTAAELGDIADEVGSIDIGKSADLAVFDGDPLEIRTSALMTIINGRIVHCTEHFRDIQEKEI